MTQEQRLDRFARWVAGFVAGVIVCISIASAVWLTWVRDAVELAGAQPSKVEECMRYWFGGTAPQDIPTVRARCPH